MDRSKRRVRAARPAVAAVTTRIRPAAALLTRRTGEPVVTRMDIADVVEDAFTQPPASKGDLLEAAASGQAPTELVAVLEQLPDQQYRTMRDLWPHLATVPVAR